jgi:heme-degrading monooxygenase HmoA
MWARVSRYQFPAVDVDRVIDYMNASADAFSTQPGLKRLDVYVSRKSGAGISITVWENLDAMKASEEEADRVREDIALELIGWVQSVEEYELVRSDEP